MYRVPIPPVQFLNVPNTGTADTVEICTDSVCNRYFFFGTFFCELCEAIKIPVLSRFISVFFTISVCYEYEEKIYTLCGFCTVAAFIIVPHI